MPEGVLTIFLLKKNLDNTIRVISLQLFRLKKDAERSSWMYVWGGQVGTKLCDQVKKEAMWTNIVSVRTQSYAKCIIQALCVLKSVKCCFRYSNSILL